MEKTSKTLVSLNKLSDSKLKVLKTKVHFIEAACDALIMMNESEKIGRICDVVLAEFRSAIGGTNND